MIVKLKYTLIVFFCEGEKKTGTAPRLLSFDWCKIREEKW